MEKRVITVDSQMLEGIQLCPRMYNYAFVQHITTQQTKDDLERGTLVHSILAKYYQNDKDIEAAIKSTWEESATLNLSGEDVEIVHNNLRDYAEHYASDRWEAIEVNGQPMIERVATKVLFENEQFIFIYQGVIDLGICISGMTLPEGLCIVDHKSAKRKGMLIDLSNQFLGYCWMTGCQRLIKNEVGFQKSMKPHERFIRHLLTYEQSRIDEWVNNSIYWIKWLIYHLEAEDWPMNLSSCSKFGGCAFLPICTSTPDFREYKIERDYKVREPWDVGRRL